MNDTATLFVDGAAYGRRMGRWSRLVSEIFLDWLAALAYIAVHQSQAAYQWLAEFRVGNAQALPSGSISYEAFANAVKARVPS